MLNDVIEDVIKRVQFMIYILKYYMYIILLLRNKFNTKG